MIERAISHPKVFQISLETKWVEDHLDAISLIFDHPATYVTSVDTFYTVNVGKNGKI